MLITYLLLAAAISFEIAGTMALKRSEGFTAFFPSLAVIACYVTAFVLLSRVLNRGMPVATAYAIWSAIGIVAVALAAAVFFGEHLRPVQYLGVASIVIGVVLLEHGPA